MRATHARLIVALVAVSTATGPWATAQASTPATIQDVIEICSPVISEEYSGVTDRWGHCVLATQDFVNFVPGTALGANPDKVSADLVYELARLYENNPELCSKYETELPQAIEVAAKFTIDEEQKKLMISISETIAECQGFETGVIPTQGRQVSIS
ncbi:MAG: hypothetical protein ABL866_07510 [Devosia sp.]